MKTKSIILLSFCALVTLSFSFASVKKGTAPKANKPAVHSTAGSNAGGFALEDKMI
jgi:hypothetical protein